MVKVSKELAKVIEENKIWIARDHNGFSTWLEEEYSDLWLEILNKDSSELNVLAMATYLNATGGFVARYAKALAVHGYEVEGENKNTITVEIETKIKGFVTCPHCWSKSVREAGEITIKCNDCRKTFIPIIK